jgi:hypothetical protein
MNIPRTTPGTLACARTRLAKIAPTNERSPPRRVLLLTAVLATVVALTGVLATAASPAHAGDAAAAAVQRKHFKCKGASKSKKLNVSWGSGHISTTIYFNNHCVQPKAIKTFWWGSFGRHMTKCFMVNPKTKGRKAYHHGATWSIYNVVSPAKC